MTYFAEWERYETTHCYWLKYWGFKKNREQINFYKKFDFLCFIINNQDPKLGITLKISLLRYIKLDSFHKKHSYLVILELWSFVIKIESWIISISILINIVASVKSAFQNVSSLFFYLYWTCLSSICVRNIVFLIRNVLEWNSN